VRRALKHRLTRLVRRPDVAIAHEFRPAPYGGSNQFLVALRGELERRGLRVAANVVASRTRACVLNAHAFDVDSLRSMLHTGCRVVHRVDGPVGTYRGTDHAVDHEIGRINRELADATVFQSRYSLEACGALGLEFRDPVVIPNAVDPAIFHPRADAPPLDGRKTRLIATSWSDNPNKGGAVYRWLEEHLDWDRFEFTFVGRSSVELRRARVVPPVESRGVAELLRAHDVFVSASRHESCSNALLEALACGLPAVYLDSGGNAELVGEAGLAFREPEELPARLERIVREHDELRRRISIPSLDEVTDRYLAVMGVA
jgi:glycosyltransferase involved in cell wall biosynthesis